MKFLVLGCNGMAGHVISLFLKENGHQVLGFARKKSNLVDSIIGDVSDTKFLESVILNDHFDAVINCVGILNQFAEIDKAQATFINAYLPHYLAKITANIPTQIVHISTDCVFSGKKGNYVEDDLRDGESFYDRSKALGELNDKKNLTLRNSIVGPDINPNGIGLLNWFLKQKNEVNGFLKSMWTGQTTLQLAKTIEFATKEKATGLMNMVPNSSISKYELLKLFNHYFLEDKKNIISIDGINANKALKRTNYSLEYDIPDYEIMIAELAKWTKQHKELYPHYEL